MEPELVAVAFDLDSASLACLREALPSWKICLLAGASSASLTPGWNPGEVELFVVQANEDFASTLALCRFLRQRDIRALEPGARARDVLGPRGSLETATQRMRAPILLLLHSWQSALTEAALEAGVHSCLVLPVHAKHVTRMLQHARAGNQPGRHTLDREGPQTEDRWRDEGGQG
jgi:hypothetical protein